MRFTDFSSVENQVKAVPGNIRCTTMLWQYTLINPHQVGFLLFWEQANNNILNAIPIGMASTVLESIFENQNMK